MEKSRKQLEQQIEELQVRLQEAEETLEAIRTGAVDAIVVSQGQQEQVFTLQGAESTYRIILENMSEGAATLSTDGTIVYCNARFAEILGVSLDQVMGTRIEQYVLPGDRAGFNAMLVQSVLDESRGEVRFQRGDLTTVPMYLSLNGLPTGQMASVSLVATDLREQKRLEEVLAAEELARSILEQAAEPIIVCDAKGIIIRASQAAHGLCGCNLIRQPFHKALPLKPSDPQAPKDQQQPFDTNRLLCVGEIMSGRICRNLEMVLEREGGQTFDLLVSAAPLINRQGQSVGCVLGLTDITERKRAAEVLANRSEELATTIEEMELVQEELRTTNDELVAAQESLRDQRQRYLDLFESAPDGYVVTDGHGSIREANQAAGALLQEEQADLAGKPLLLFVPAALQEDYQTMLEKLAAAEGVHRWDAQLQTRQKARIDAAVTIAVVRDDEGKLESLRWMLRDVTEQRQAAEKLREQAELLNLAHDAILVRDLEGRIRYWNHGAQEVYGWSAEEAIGQVSHDLLQSRFPQTLAAIMAVVLEHGRWEGEKTNTRRDGRQLAVDSRWALLRNQAGKPTAILEINRDITERKQAEEALRLARTRSEESLAQLQAVVESMTDALVIADPAGNLVYHNPASIALHGYRTPEEAKRPADKLAGLWEIRELSGRLLAPEEWPIGRSLRGERYANVELLVRRPDTGKEFIGSYNGTPVLDPRGQMILAIVTIRDVTEIKMAERALQQSEARLRAFFQQAAVGTAVADPATGRFLEANSRFCEITGYEESELLNRTFVDITHPADRPADRDQYARLVSGAEREYVTEKRYIRKDGQEAWVHVAVAMLRDTEGKPLQSVGVIQDITRRKQAEEALRLSKETFATAFAGNAAAIVMTRLEDGLFLDVNDTWVAMTGYSREDAIGHHVGETNIWPTTDARARFVQELRDKGSLRGWEQRLLRKSGETYVVQLSAQVLTVQGEKVILSTLVDITDRKRAEQQLQELNATLEQRVAERTVEVKWRAAQLQRLASQLTQAEQRERRRLAEILHDHLQQLLVAAKFNLGIIRTQVPDENLRQPLRQVEELLDQSVETSRSLTVELSPPVLHSGGLGQALHWLAGWMQDRQGLTVRVEAQPEANPQTEDMRVLLFQAVRELLFNAVKHAQTKDAFVQMTSRGADWLQIVVSDAGRGFDPKKRLSQEGSSGGFGLFSVRERLELLGGRMDIDSAPGQGTRITLLAPLRPLPPAGVMGGANATTPIGPDAAYREAGPSGATQPPAAQKRTRVLVADDHAVVRDSLVRLVQMQPDMELVGQAADGQQAVELARRLRPDVVIMDVNMPEMNGVEATRRIREEMPDTRVVGLSLHTDADWTEPMRQAGAVDCLSKGSSPEELLRMVRADTGKPPKR